MSDYIKREDALNVITNHGVYNEISLACYTELLNGLKDIPSAVVRCKKCKHFREMHDGLGFCNNCKLMKQADGYCDEGTSKED